jgi:5-oxoprolinase (ATP-hydrolysing) subunit A
MAMRKIDLNVDLGEGGSHDAELIAHASSANIACGGHAGDEETMRLAIQHCIAHGVAIGAHPGYEDQEHFGRRELNMEPEEVTEMIARQLDRFSELVTQAGAKIHHVKPHGALYNQADREPALAAAVIAGVKRILGNCECYVPPSGALARACREAQIPIKPEGFVDRRYLENASLVPRSEPEAIVDDPRAAVAQALQIARDQAVRCISGGTIPLPAETLCIHGDGPKAVELLGAVRAGLEAAGFVIHS